MRIASNIPAENARRHLTQNARSLAAQYKAAAAGTEEGTAGRVHNDFVVPADGVELVKGQHPLLDVGVFNRALLVHNAKQRVLNDVFVVVEGAEVVAGREDLQLGRKGGYPIEETVDEVAELILDAVVAVGDTDTEVRAANRDEVVHMQAVAQDGNCPRQEPTLADADDVDEEVSFFKLLVVHDVDAGAGEVSLHGRNNRVKAPFHDLYAHIVVDVAAPADYFCSIGVISCNFVYEHDGVTAVHVDAVDKHSGDCSHGGAGEESGNR